MNQKQVLEQIQTSLHGTRRPFKVSYYKDGNFCSCIACATHHLAWVGGQNWINLNSTHTYKIEEEIESKGFVVEYGGDPSVGMTPQTWKLEGDFHFSSREDFEAFKVAIAGAFEYCSDTPIVCVSKEEWADEINKELAPIGGRFHL